jgi:predicted ribosome quality control (RQC) complex YloA/Tae2 family protein
VLSRADIERLVGVLAPRVVGGQLQKAWQPDPGTLVLRVRRPGETVFLVLSAGPGVARIAERTDRPRRAMDPIPALGQWVRAALCGRRVDALEQVDGDRVVRLTCDTGAVVAELTGRHANLFALDAEGTVRATARPSSSTRRALRPGGAWSPPRPPDSIDDEPLRFDDPRALEAEAERVAAAHQAGERARLLEGARRRLRRLEKNVRGDVARFEGADRDRALGELLKPEIHRMHRGMERITVRDWYAEGAPEIEVPLDPKLDGATNVARFFARYKRARAGVSKARARLSEVERALAAVDAIEADTASLDDTRAALEAGGWLRAGPQGSGPRKARAAARRPFFEWVSSRGERILVGRGGADNHATTFHVGRGNDHWLHVRDAPGAHVIVPLPGRGREPHAETLLDAAALAVANSKLSGEAVVEVTHTRRKHVRAISGGPAGRVTIADARSITVHDAETRIAGLRRV